jgi:hypothetical protein
VAVVVLMGGGVTFALRDRIFGAGGVALDTTRTQLPPDGPAVDTPRTDAFSHPDSTAPSPGTGASANGRSETRNPPAGGPVPANPPARRDSVPKPPPGGYPTIPTAAGVTLPAVDDIFDPGLRDGARQKAEAIYQRRDVSDSVRAMAANMVAVAYQSDNKFGDALVWAQRSQDLRATPEGQAFVDRLKKLVSP